MSDELNRLRWDRTPGHYEVYYVALTDRASGTGLWVRATLEAPLQGAPVCELWFMAMDPRERDESGAPLRIGRKARFGIDRLSASDRPFQLDIDNATLTDRGFAGAFEDVSWELSWTPGEPGQCYVSDLLQKAKIAKTVPTVVHPDIEITGTVSFAGRRLDVRGRGSQTHIFGTKHANRWVWAHGGDFETLDGEPRPGVHIDGVSAYVPRFGRDIGPLTLVQGNVGGRRFAALGPPALLRNRSVIALTGWSFQAIDGDLRVVAEVDAERDEMVGVTYHDPDGEACYCYNSEIATMRLQVFTKPKGEPRWRLIDSLVAPKRAHFEYAQRDRIPGLELHVT
jgi:hypothetical protein